MNQSRSFFNQNGLATKLPATTIQAKEPKTKGFKSKEANKPDIKRSWVLSYYKIFILLAPKRETDLAYTDLNSNHVKIICGEQTPNTDLLQPVIENSTSRS